MLTKRYLQETKEKNIREIYRLLQDSNSHNILFILKNLGHLSDNFDENVLISLIHHANPKIRFWAIKNLGKICNSRLIDLLVDIIHTDTDSMVRREAVSSIGRMRLPQTIPQLLALLKDDDPKIVLQAIRGLLVFKEDLSISKVLRQLSTHPNEIVRSVIRQEFAEKSQPSNQQSHSTSPDFMKNVVVHADVLKILKYVPDESIHLTFTSPPYYNARDYSIYKSYSAYLNFLSEVFNQIHRITKEGRFLVVNTSPIIIPRVSRSHASQRYPIPFDLHSRLVQNGWEFIDDIIWLKPESSAKNRNASFLQHRKPLGYKPNAITEYLMVYRKETDKLLDWNMNQYQQNIIEDSRIQGDYETSNVWKIDPTFDKIHTAVFPLELCHRVIQFYSYKGDLIFDPFAGSGTLGKAAKNLDRYFFLTEQEETYVHSMKLRLSSQTFFGGLETRFLSLNEFITFSSKGNYDIK